MDSIEQDVCLPKLDDAGLIIDPNHWNEEVALILANSLGIEKLTEDHWLVIHELRKYYKKFGVAPAMQLICNQHKKDKSWVRNLFGMCLNAWCVAGLPDPGEEAKAYLNST